MAITEEIRVTGISQYKTAMSQAKQAVKTWDEELKKNESSLKATGNQEQYLADKTKILQNRMTAQANAAKNAEAALKAMREQGVSPMNTEYQRMQQELTRAQTGILETTAALDQLKRGEMDAASGADQLTASVNGIGKKISLDQVIGGIDKITSGLEAAAKKAVSLGQMIWDEITRTAAWADDTATQARLLDMNVEDYQKYRQVFETVGELTVQDWMNAKRKVQDAIYSPSQEQMDVFAALGISPYSIKHNNGVVVSIAKDWEDLFWEIGGRLQEEVASGNMTQGLADTYFEALFGKKYMNYKPLLDMGQEGFQQAVEKQKAVAEETVDEMSKLNDKLTELKNKFNTLEADVLGGLAPALEKGADALSNLLDKLIEYLETPEGQKMLEDMGKAVEGLFDDLGKISPEMVVEGFAKVFGDIVTGITWISEHWPDVVAGIEGIGMAFLTMKGIETVLTIIQLINGLKGLGIGGGGAGGAGTGSGGGTGLIGNIGTTLVTAAKIAPFALPPALLVDSLVRNQQIVSEAQAAGQEQILEYGSAAEKYSGSEMFGVWDQLKGFTSITGKQNGQANDEAMRAFAEHYFQWFNDEVTDTALDKLSQSIEDNYGMEAFDSFHAAMEHIINGDVLYSNEEQQSFLDALNTAVKAAEAEMENNPPAVTIEPEVPENSAEVISEEIGTVPVKVAVEEVEGDELAAILGQLGGPGHANGLSYVPYNGLYMLHRGERVVPAREVNSHNYSSNLYVESMYMNNGTDANGLADAMAAAQRRTMSGYGS